MPFEFVADYWTKSTEVKKISLAVLLFLLSTSFSIFFFWRHRHRNCIKYDSQHLSGNQRSEDVEANSSDGADELIARMRRNQQDSDHRTDQEHERLLEQEESLRQMENDEKERKRETDEKIRQIARDAEEIQRLQQEKMDQYRQQSNENFKKFANAINTRLQWEQQDQEWSNWLQNIRISIAEVLSTGNDSTFIKNMEALQSILCWSFRDCQNWYTVSSVSEKKKLFLLIIMKSIGQVSEINEKLYELTSENNSMRPGSEISKVLHELSVDMIPTTSKLKEIESNADQNDYKKILEPHPFPSTSVIIEEIND